jgi:hypothetical protein
MLQVAQHANHRHKALLTTELEEAYIVEVARSLQASPRSDVLKQVEMELRAVLVAPGQSWGAAEQAQAKMVHRVHETLLFADVAVSTRISDSRGFDGGGTLDTQPVALMLVDACTYEEGGAKNHGQPRLLAAAELTQWHFAALGWRVAWLRVEEWARAGTRSARQKLLSELVMRTCEGDMQQ